MFIGCVSVLSSRYKQYVISVVTEISIMWIDDYY